MAKKRRTQNDKYFPIVGIGGSAGAIEAVIEILAHLPSSTGMSFIYLQHQNPDFESKMVQVLTKKSKLPVLEAEEGMPVEPDFFYVVPPGKEMTVAGGEFQLQERNPSYDHLPINRF